MTSWNSQRKETEKDIIKIIDFRIREINLCLRILHKKEIIFDKKTFKKMNKWLLKNKLKDYNLELNKLRKRVKKIKLDEYTFLKRYFKDDDVYMNRKYKKKKDIENVFEENTYIYHESPI